jgi:hypothetical protein
VALDVNALAAILFTGKANQCLIALFAAALTCSLTNKTKRNCRRNNTDSRNIKPLRVAFLLPKKGLSDIILFIQLIRKSRMISRKTTEHEYRHLVRRFSSEYPHLKQSFSVKDIVEKSKALMLAKSLVEFLLQSKANTVLFR